MDIEIEEKTVIFCTAFDRCNDSYYTWDVRYRLWIEAIRRSSVHFDQILLVDDGSKHLPAWPDVTILHDGEDLLCDAPLVIRHFADPLGRPTPADFPGWVRSFFSVAPYAEVNGFTKVVHIEADAFLITQRACDYINGLRDGWTALWCDRHKWPESGIQVITGSGLHVYKEWASKPIEDFAGACIELTLPFSHVERDLVGDRYGEAGKQPPRNADWCMQASPPKLANYARYFWWMPWFSDVFPELGSKKMDLVRVLDASTKLTHDGIYYLQWLHEAERILAPRMYFEIGTHTGDSLKQIGCDAVCIDPNFAITTNVLMRRRSTHFFQGTSDNFFAEPGNGVRLFPAGVDLAFLDGLHLYEALLRDFINTERFMTPGSMIVLHDCLPLNARMAERVRRDGDESEPAGTRGFWTGDVWKVVLILDKYRPEMKLTYLDCGPTGLVVCTGLDRLNTVMSDRYHEIVTEFQNLNLESFGLQKLWALYPTFSSAQIVLSEDVFNTALFDGNCSPPAEAVTPTA